MLSPGGPGYCRGRLIPVPGPGADNHNSPIALLLPHLPALPEAGETTSRTDRGTGTGNPTARTLGSGRLFVTPSRTGAAKGSTTTARVPWLTRNERTLYWNTKFPSITARAANGLSFFPCIFPTEFHSLPGRLPCIPCNDRPLHADTRSLISTHAPSSLPLEAPVTYPNFLSPPVCCGVTVCTTADFLFVSVCVNPYSTQHI
jgi:hypothetical protein